MQLRGSSADAHPWLSLRCHCNGKFLVSIQICATLIIIGPSANCSTGGRIVVHFYILEDFEHASTYFALFLQTVYAVENYWQDLMGMNQSII